MGKKIYFSAFCLVLLIFLAVLGVAPGIRRVFEPGRHVPKLQVSVPRDFLTIPYLHIVSTDSLPIRISDIIVNRRYHLFGFCNVVFVGELDSLGIRHCSVELGAVYPRYLPGDPSYPAKISSLNGCGVSGRDSLRMGESMDVKSEDFGYVQGNTFEPMKVRPVTLEIKTDRGSVTLKISPEQSGF